MLRVAGMQRDPARGLGQHVLDQRAGKADAPVIAQHRPAPVRISTPDGRRIGKPDHLQRIQRRGVDLRHPRIGQGLVLPARHARPHRAHLLGQGAARSATRAARPPARRARAAHPSSQTSSIASPAIFCLQISSGGAGGRSPPVPPVTSAPVRFRVIHRHQRRHRPVPHAPPPRSRRSTPAHPPRSPRAGHIAQAHRTAQEMAIVARWSPAPTIRPSAPPPRCGTSAARGPQPELHHPPRQARPPLAQHRVAADEGGLLAVLTAKPSPASST
jgi:hypothetical protein